MQPLPPLSGWSSSGRERNWIWIAIGLFRKDREPVAELRCFFGGHVLLAAGMASFALALNALLDDVSRVTWGLLFAAAGA